MKSMFTIAFFLLCLPAANGVLFPKVCVQGVAQWPVVCCPYYKTSRCGSSAGRGSCLAVPVSRSEPAPDITLDERHNAPVFFFNWTCQCSSRFMGYNCGECFFGWTGDNCDIAHRVTRRNILSLTLAEVEIYLAKCHYCKSKIDPEYVILRTADRFRKRSLEFIEGSYLDVLAFIHYYGTKPFNSDAEEIFITNYAHGSTGFLTWHSLYLLYLERQMQKCLKDNTFALLYYKWEDDKDCAICNNIYIGASDYYGKISKYSVFSEWRMICAVDYPQAVCLTEDCVCERPRIARMPGFALLTKPTAADVNVCMNMTNVDTAPYNGGSEKSFRNCIEGWHNIMHVYFGGSMGTVPTAANDIMFSLHHCNVDRLADMYYRKFSITPSSYPPNTVYGHEPRTCITPFYNCIRNRDMMRPCSYFGITYE